MTTLLITLTLWIAGSLCVLNIACAIFFRKKRLPEIASYLVAALIELAICVFALLLHLSILRHIPYHLPPGLPFNRAEIGAAAAIGIGLFPIAFWHRNSSTRIRAMMEKEAKEMRDHEASVRVRAPGEWINS